MQRSASECIRRGKVMLRCVCSAARRRLGAHGGGEGQDTMCRHAHSLYIRTDLHKLSRTVLKQSEQLANTDYNSTYDIDGPMLLMCNISGCQLSICKYLLEKCVSLNVSNVYECL